MRNTKKKSPPNIPPILILWPCVGVECLALHCCVAEDAACSLTPLDKVFAFLSAVARGLWPPFSNVPSYCSVDAR